MIILHANALSMQAHVVDWLLENGVDRDKICYHGQKPLDVIGQCRSDIEAAAAIRHALSAELKSERPACGVFCLNVLNITGLGNVSGGLGDVDAEALRCYTQESIGIRKSSSCHVPVHSGITHQTSNVIEMASLCLFY